MAGNWMKGAVKNPGGLHRALGVPEGQKIPAARLAAARNSKDPKVRRMASLATTFAKTRPKKASVVSEARKRSNGSY